MSDYYKVPRKESYNYGGKHWKLSRSKIDLFTECPRCFYIDNKLGIKRPPGYPFNLNSAVDALLKTEFDVHRAANKVHPLLHSYGLDLVPYQNVHMDEWRENFKGVKFDHAKTGFTITGAVDDIWVDKKKNLYVVDYKSTAKKDDIKELNQAWQDGYKRQMEVYQWLLRQNGYTVSDTGYFVYCNGMADKEAFDARLEFRVTLIPHQGSDAWVEGTLEEIKQCLDSPKVPQADPDCDYCAYREAIGKLKSK